MPVTNALKLVLHWTGLGEEGTLQWYFEGSSGLHTPAQLQAAAGNAVNNWNTVRTPSSKTQFTNLLCAAQQVDKVTLYEYATLPGPASELGVFAVTGWAGTGVVAAPLQCSIVSSVHTATSGASYRGRQYFPGHCRAVDGTTMLLPNSAVDGVAAPAANMGSEAAQAIASSLGIGTLRWAVYSPKRGIMTDVTTISVDNKMDTQRRREKSLKATYVKTVTAQ